MLTDRLEFRVFVCRTIWEGLMGCFFGCFGVNNGDRRRDRLDSNSFNSKNNLASVLLSDEKSSLDNTIDDDGDDKELKDEAKFLKSCGTILETPAEIRKVLKTQHDEEHVSSESHSRLPCTSSRKLHWEVEPDQDLISPKIPMHETLDFAENKSSRRKSVRFECAETVSPINSDTDFVPLTRCSPSKINSHQSYEESDYPSINIAQAQLGPKKISPFSTPLKLSDEMQTPGSVYPSTLDNFEIGKNARIRSQYVFPVLNPVENLSQWNALKEDPNTNQLIGQSREFLEQSEVATPDGRDQNHHTLVTVNSSLSDLLKPISPIKEISCYSGNLSDGKSYSRKSPNCDRPILGTVAAHWNDDEPSHISPKWWDGNGIPNSTNKYKEDQKVSWHATPFEERLEKALSEESILPQSKKLLDGIALHLVADEESDTAESHLQPPMFNKHTVV